MIKYISLIIILSIISVYPQDKHKHHEEKESSDTTKYSDMEMNMRNQMHSDMNLNRHGSGTGWLPDNSPMYGYMIMSGEWMYMIHGNIFIRYNSQDITENGSRGDAKFDAPNWVMVMARNNINHSGSLRLSAMLSFDPVTVGGFGYPLLFQSGETWEGKPLVDRQHPHDLFSELSVEYTHSLSDDVDIIGYFGYPGEPAIGPVAFMHRSSALNNPDAPLGHHWQDATHITFGVGTLGLKIRDYKLEGSLFTGREPNENRYNFDKPKFDSYSVRLSANPMDEFALQVSHAFLKSPESIDPNENIRRTTASVIHNKNFIDGTILSTSVIWGFNNVIDKHKEHSVLLESNIKLHETNLYGRFEWVQKSGDELELPGLLHNDIFDIIAVTLGANYSFFRFNNTNLIFGLQGSIFQPDEMLITYYGSNPLSLEVYLRISPAMMMQ